jgi:hypothetical protein
MPTPDRSSGGRFGPSRAERDKAARDKYKKFILADIEGSHKRRQALETMWKAETDKSNADRKSAVQEYKTVMESEPDFTDDDEGIQRARWNNQPHVQAAKDRMRTHIEASMQQSNPARQETDAQGKITLTNQPKRSQTTKTKAKETDPQAGNTGTFGKVKIQFTGEVIEKDGQRYFMGTDENGRKVGVPEAQYKKRKKDPEVEETGEYRGNKPLRAIAGFLGKTATREDVPYTP